MLTLASMRTAAAQGAPPSFADGRSSSSTTRAAFARASACGRRGRRRGDRYPETVLLRLITERGRPSVKINASEEAAGLSLAGPSSTKDTYVILESKGTASSLKMKNEDGREQILKP